MGTVFCRRCRKEIYDVSREAYTIYKNVYKDNTSIHLITVPYHLCNECGESFKKWINRPKEVTSNFVNCKSSGCHYYDGFGCTRSPVVKQDEEQCPCDVIPQKPIRSNRKRQLTVSI